MAALLVLILPEGLADASGVVALRREPVGERWSYGAGVVLGVAAEAGVGAGGGVAQALLAGLAGGCFYEVA